MYLSETTVKRKLQDIFEKLDVTTRAQAAAEAVRRGLV
jgi:DNA-binding NarL/FixJ family response regulator